MPMSWIYACEAFYALLDFLEPFCWSNLLKYSVVYIGIAEMFAFDGRLVHECSVFLTACLGVF